MPKQTTINDAAIRAASVQIEQLAQQINHRAKLLCEQFDALYPNMRFADPVKDTAFDRYMIAIARAKSLCEVCPSLAYQAREMQRFGLPDPAADYSTLNRVPLDMVPDNSRNFGCESVAIPA